PLSKKDVFIDQHGLVRLRRRLDCSDMEYEVKFPVVVLDHKVVRSYLKHIHQTVAQHAQIPTTEAIIRQTVYLPGLNRILSKVIKECMSCNALYGKPFTPPVAPLPADRVSPGRAFEVVGIDLFGPLHNEK